MNKISKFIFMPMVSFLMLSGCNMGVLPVDPVDPEPEVKASKTIFVNEHKDITDELVGVKFIEHSEYSENWGETVRQSFTYELTNLKDYEIEMKYTIKAYREGTDKTYDVTHSYPQYTLAAKEKITCVFISIFDGYTRNAKYNLDIIFNTFLVNLKLYNRPDELRDHVTINRRIYLDDKIEFVENCILPVDESIYYKDFMSSDYFYGCNKWYYDEAMTQSVKEEDRFSEDITVYGKAVSILQYTYYALYEAYYVTGYNMIPTQGTIVFPRTYKGINVSGIDRIVFHYSHPKLQRVYFPYELKRVENGNFDSVTNLLDVYYEGTRSELYEVFAASIKYLVGQQYHMNEYINF